VVPIYILPHNGTAGTLIYVALSWLGNQRHDGWPDIDDPDG